MRDLEHRLQVACVRWFRYAYPDFTRLLFAVPNGGQRNAVTAIRLKAEGVVSGVADLLLLVPRKDKHGLCIEMKTDKGVQSENQKLWQKDIEAQQYEYFVCRSFDEFEKIINNYLSVVAKNATVQNK